jgi:transposase-like protein
MTAPHSDKHHPVDATMQCPYCRSTEQQIKDGRNRSGSQRYKCKVCGGTYTPNPRRNGYHHGLRRKAELLHRAGMSFREVARELGINHQTVANWVTRHIERGRNNKDNS